MIALRSSGSAAPPYIWVPGAKVCGLSRKASSALPVQVPCLAFRPALYWKSGRLAILRPTTPLRVGASGVLAAPITWHEPQLSLKSCSPVAPSAGEAASARTKASAMRIRRLRAVSSPERYRDAKAASRRWRRRRLGQDRRGGVHVGQPGAPDVVGVLARQVDFAGDLHRGADRAGLPVVVDSVALGLAVGLPGGLGLVEVAQRRL